MNIELITWLDSALQNELMDNEQYIGNGDNYQCYGCKIQRRDRKEMNNDCKIGVYVYLKYMYENDTSQLTDIIQKYGFFVSQILDKIKAGELHSSFMMGEEYEEYEIKEKIHKIAVEYILFESKLDV